MQQWCYNNRMQPKAIRVGATVTSGCTIVSGDLLHLGFTYGTTDNNGNVKSQTIGQLTHSALQSYEYDGLNRLKSVTEASNFQNYDYDQYGNRWVTTASTAWTPGSFTPRTSSWYDAGNRLVNSGLGIQYDAAGNQTAAGGYSFTYDAENRVKTSTSSGGTTTYAYDGEGRRVKKNSTVFVYDAFGKLAAEYGGTSPATGTQYLTQDHLGSTRLVTNAAGAEVTCYDYELVGIAYWFDGESMRALIRGTQTAEPVVKAAGIGTALVMAGAFGGIGYGAWAGGEIGALGLAMLPSQARSIQAIENAIANHVKMSDLAGAAKETAGFTIRTGGKIWNHRQELIETARTLRRAVRALEGSLNDLSHGAVTRQIVQQAIQKAETALRQIDIALRR